MIAILIWKQWKQECLFNTKNKKDIQGNLGTWNKEAAKYGLQVNIYDDEQKRW